MDTPTPISLDGLMSAKGAMSVEEFCSWASIGRRKFYQEVSDGHLKMRKVGRRSVITAQDAIAWLSALPEAKS